MSAKNNPSCFSDLLDKVESEANGIRDGRQLVGETESSSLALLLDPILSAWLYTVKDRAFQDECEWRLVLLPSVDDHGYLDYENLLFRPSEIGPIPYIVARPGNGSSADSKLPLVGVKCGPNIAHEAVEHAVRLLLKKYCFSEAAKKVSSSTIPVRRS